MANWVFSFVINFCQLWPGIEPVTFGLTLQCDANYMTQVLFRSEYRQRLQRIQFLIVPYLLLTGLPVIARLDEVESRKYLLSHLSFASQGKVFYLLCCQFKTQTRLAVPYNAVTVYITLLMWHLMLLYLNRNGAARCRRPDLDDQQLITTRPNVQFKMIKDS